MVLEPYQEEFDHQGCHIDFGRPFRGTIRLTIRNASKGTTLHINGNQYVCSGEMDEQAYYRFHAEQQKDFMITHLHMVRHYLQSNKNRCQQTT